MFQDKKKMRKKAMDMMMKAGPTIAIKIAKKQMPMPEAGNPMEAAPEQAMDEANDGHEMAQGPEDQMQKGYESFMVSPQEKNMILSMRKQDQQEPGEELEVGMKPGMAAQHGMA